MNIRTVWKVLTEKSIEWLLVALAPSVLTIYLLTQDQLLEIAKTYPLLWLIRILVLLLVLCLALSAWIYLKQQKFTEYRGAFFKHKSGGGFHNVVYCGACKLPVAIDSRAQFLDLQFKCKCGWVSSFNLGEFNVFFPTLKP